MFLFRRPSVSKVSKKGSGMSYFCLFLCAPPALATVLCYLRSYLRSMSPASRGRPLGDDLPKCVQTVNVPSVLPTSLVRAT